MTDMKRKRELKLSREEIGLIKAMLAAGMKNDEAHFYFNRADRLISSGRIAQIRKGSLGASVPPATKAELETFIEGWRAKNNLGKVLTAASPTDAAVIIALFESVEGTWKLRSGETNRTECKKNFRLKPEERFSDAIRTIAGFANNKGGYLFFGVDNKTMIADGLSEAWFADTDPAEINRTLISALDPVPHITKTVVEVGGQSIGVLHVEPHEHPPVMAVKNIGQEVKEGAIYFRYEGESRPIKPGELRQIIARREQQAVAEFTRRMNQVAVGSAATIDLDTGKVTGKNGAFVIDRELLPSIQFIREGEFTELKGAPALRLIGDVEPVSEAERERVRVIRENVTPDAVLRNFLSGTSVADPLSYIHAQAHFQRKWLPIWYYVSASKTPVTELIQELKSRVASRPSSLDAIISRISQTETAHRMHVGQPNVIRAALVAGQFPDTVTASTVMHIANAVMSLSEKVTDMDRLKKLMLACLTLSDGDDAPSRARRSTIYRAACRLDELLHAPVKMPAFLLNASRPARARPPESNLQTSAPPTVEASED
ncbi:ATP-binding protein [Methylorubrum populi]|uniref:AlbA family DNA-binding domain-containing protein n=1 Tax=Methylorubrum populi TaxID=223967 RepID=UPI0031F811A4